MSSLSKNQELSNSQSSLKMESYKNLPHSRTEWNGKIMRFKRKVLLMAMCLCSMLMMGNAHATNIVNQSGNVVVGYWHNWCGARGYQRGTASCIKLDQVNSQYNVVNISFMRVFDPAEGRIPTFKLDPAFNEQAFINQIAQLNQQGRSVLIALGGADAHIEMQKGDEQAFADEIIRLTDLYGFDGLDIDLEQAAITAADNQTVIPAALKIVKNYYRTQNENFLITMAPEFPYLRSSGAYVSYLEGLEGYYDWINPQFYNQGGDGLFINGLGWIAQNNDSLKSEFIYYISDSLINGTRGYYKISNDKLVFGIPANIDAAATGYIQDPEDLYSAFEQLSDQGQPLRGVMTWSVNWDTGVNANGRSYDEEFIKAYGPFVHGQTTQPPSGKPVIMGADNARILLGSAFNPLAGVTAVDTEDGVLTSALQVEGAVYTNQIGSYVLTYRVEDSDKNVVTQPRTIEVYNLKPVISGAYDITIVLGDSFDQFAGVTATDPEDGDLTDKLTVLGSVDTHRVGSYTLTYQVTDTANQTTRSERTVTVTVTDGDVCAADAWDQNVIYVGDDKVSYNGITWVAGWWTTGDTPGTTGRYGVWRESTNSDCGNPEPEANGRPIIQGANDITIDINSVFSPSVGVTATDPEDGDLTGQISVSGLVYTDIAGVYTLTYEVTDSANQLTSVDRKVTVHDNSGGGVSCTAETWNENTIYYGSDLVSHNGRVWAAGWWTKGDEPGTTGQWGVWREPASSNCGS